MVFYIIFCQQIFNWTFINFCKCKLFEKMQFLYHIGIFHFNFLQARSAISLSQFHVSVALLLLVESLLIYSGRNQALG